MPIAKNTICIWYDKDAEAAARFYASVFPDSAVTAVHRAPSDYPSGKAGDVLTFPLGPHIRVIKVLAPGTRRGPAPEAQALYEDLSPPQPREKRGEMLQPAQREPGSGRPTKRERRALDHLMGEENED